MDVNSYIGRRVKEARKSQGLRQSELGSMLRPKRGVATVSAWETGKALPSPSVLFELCQILRIEIADLYPPIDGNERPAGDIELMEFYKQMDQSSQKVLLEVARKFAHPNERR